MNIASFTVAFTTNAQVSLVLMCVVPALMLVILVLISVLIRVTKRLDKANEEAGGTWRSPSSEFYVSAPIHRLC